MNPNNPPRPPRPPIPPVPPLPPFGSTPPNPLKMPPIPKHCVSPFTLYQEVPSLQNENMTYIEYLMGLLAYINQWIEHYNQLVDIVEDHEKRITKLEETIESLLQEFQELKEFVEQQINSFVSRLDELELTVSNIQTDINDINRNITALQQQIDKIDGPGGANGELSESQLEQIRQQMLIRNPITGTLDPVQKVCEDLFELHRIDGLTAQEYDDLEKTADEYIAYDMTAYQYAMQAKTIMV